MCVCVCVHLCGVLSQRVGEESLDKLLTLDDVGEMKCLLHLVKDPLSSWLDSKVCGDVHYIEY